MEIQRLSINGVRSNALVQQEPRRHLRFFRSATNLIIVQLSNSSFVGAACDAFWRHAIDKLSVSLIVSIESCEILFGREKKDAFRVWLDTSKFAFSVHKIPSLEEANQVKTAQARGKPVWRTKQLLPRSFARAVVDATSMANGISWRSTHPSGVRAQ
jgi:hypothetical protein